MTIKTVSYRITHHKDIQMKAESHALANAPHVTRNDGVQFYKL